MSARTPTTRPAMVLLAFCAGIMIACPGCGLWASNKEAIHRSDLRVIDPYDGSKVYPLSVIIMGSDQRIEKLGAPLRLLEHRMSERSEYTVIRAADCGVLACYANSTGVAKRALDRAIGLSEAALSDKSQVSKASGVTGSEKAKMFAGEPHEIAALHVFRGLIFLADNDPENAKSCFLKASLADAMALQDEKRSNWLTADVLATLAFRLYGSNVRADDHVEMIKTHYPQAVSDNGWVDGAALAGLKKDGLTVVVVAVGNPPVKYGKGALQYAESESKVKSVLVQGTSAWLTDNVYVQAVTRGRRNMDDILTARRRVREGTETAGSIALTAAGIAGGPVGSAVQLAVMTIIDSVQEIDTDADSRQVGAIPGQFHVWASNSLQPGEALTIELRNRTNKPIARGVVTVPRAHASGPTVVLAWFPR